MMNNIIHTMSTNTITTDYVNLKFNDNVIISLSTSSFLFKQSKLLQSIEIDEDNNIPILCSSIYIVSKYNHIFLDKKDLSFMVNLTITKFLNICKFLDILCYENKDTLFSKQFIIYVMKNIKEQIYDIHYFMQNEIRSIMNYINKEDINLQIKSCAPIFYMLYLTKYKEEVIKFNRIDIFELSLNKQDYYKYIHKYDNKLTYHIKHTNEYNNYVIKISKQLIKECKEIGDLTFIKSLVEQGANINLQNNYGNTALHKASMYHNIEFIKYLIEQGADVNIQNIDGQTALHNALKDNINIVLMNNGILEVIKYLIEQGANINLRDNGGNTVLHNASMYYNIEISKYLIEQGANVNLQNNRGRTPLHCAARYNNIKIIKYFIEQGADVNLRDNNGNIVSYYRR